MPTITVAVGEQEAPVSQWLSTKAALKYLGVSAAFLKFLREKRGLNAYKPGKGKNAGLFFKKEELDACMARSKV